MPEAPHQVRPVGEVLGAGVFAGLIAGLAAGAIDALWSWGPASQFVPGFLSHLRFTVFAAVTYAAAGAFAGLLLAGGGLVISRASLLGDLVRFGLREHAARQARDPAEAVLGLALVLAAIPCVSAALVVAFRVVVPFVRNRKELGLVVIVAMGGALVGLAIGVGISLVIARAIATPLGSLARKWSPLASPLAPVIAIGALIAIAVTAWLVTEWETARQLPLHAPAAVALGGGLAIAAARPGLALAIRLRELPSKIRIGAWAALPFVLLLLVLAAGGSNSVIKAASAYTGLGGPIARTLRVAFDWDRDGYARFLGGGDCDDGDRNVHPGAPEIPDDGIDQNCVGGDATAKRGDDVAFAPVPATVPADTRILLITIDTVRADHFGMYGYPRKTSPNLDALAGQGTVFEHGWAHAPSTRYSIPAILTGRYPLNVHYDKSIDGWPGIALKATTIAESLAPLGFHTGAITNYSYFDKSRRMDQGFAEYDNSNASRHTGVAGAGPAQTKGSSSKEQTDKAIAFVERNSDKRWFLWVHYYDPHYAYEPHPEVKPFGGGRVDLYDGEIAYTDLHIGRLLETLKTSGLYDKTIVVVTGDHGEGFGEHGIDLHGYHLYAPQTKVPFAIRVPGLAARRSTTPAGHVDILPTLVNLAGGKPDPDMMGQSLVGALAGTDRDRVVFQQLSYEGNHEMRAAADRQCHVIYNVSPDTSWEVYRIDRDPLETTDLASEGECETTRAAIERWYDSEQIPAGAAQALLPGRPAIAAPIDTDFGSSVRLLQCVAPATAKPGESIELGWTFEARDEVERGWKLFVHLQGPNKATYINGDHTPARPFEWWRPGQFIAYTTSVTIPRNAMRGRYAVQIGMFKGKDRAPARSTSKSAPVSDNAVTCTSIEVAP